MTTYVIGDVHGCFSQLKKLLKKIRFNPDKDRLWFVGDLVNRGADSLHTLRFVKSLGDSAITVLGNHDLHLLAVAYGHRKPSGKDIIRPILKARDCDELCDWLAERPLLHNDDTLRCTLVHAGIHPQWSLKRAKRLAKQLHRELKTDPDKLLENMYGNTPRQWDKELDGHKLNRFAINVFTRMRFCDENGALDFEHSSSPLQAPKRLMPWYEVERKKPLKNRVMFGHWSAHPSMGPAHVMPNDRGCLWGGCLSAYAIESNTSTWVRCK